MGVSYMGMTAKVGVRPCGNRFCVHVGDKDGDDRDYHRNRNHSAPVETKSCACAYAFSEA